MDESAPQNVQVKRPSFLRRGLSGSTLKLIAMAFMFIDHVGAVVLEQLLRVYGIQNIQTSADAAAFLLNYGTLYRVDLFLRYCGRIAFPLFLFLLVEGFVHTQDRKKYGLRLLAFAFLSEIPFDLAISHTILEFQNQNVFFTLFFAFLTLCAIEWASRQKQIPKGLNLLLQLLCAGAGMWLAFFFKTDYGAFGVAAAAAMYLLRRRRVLGGAAGCAALTAQVPVMEWTCFFSLLPIAAYNGKRGITKNKYLFYAFYPLHLLLLYGVCACLGVV